jgi:hypothetical protein
MIHCREFCVNRVGKEGSIEEKLAICDPVYGMTSRSLNDESIRGKDKKAKQKPFRQKA